jgi:uncharacterized membrane protein
MKTMLFLYVGSSIFLALISLPLIARKIKPNPLYGFRIQQTLDDPEVWYETNQYFAKRLFVAGILEAVAALGFYFIPNISLDVYALACLGIFVVSFSISLVQSRRHMQSYNK